VLLVHDGLANPGVAGRHRDRRAHCREDPLPARPKRWRLTDYGWECVGEDRAAYGPEGSREARPVHIADYWRSVRVGVTQASARPAHRPRPPRRSARRAVRPGPTAQPGTFESHKPDVLYVGRDDFGSDRYLPLRGLTGICVSGLPGYGKTSLISSWLCQLTATPAAQFALAGRQGRRRPGTLARPRLAPRRRRARRRPRRPRGRSTPRCGAASAPSVRCAGSGTPGTPAAPPTSLPLLVTVIDECQTYLDLAQHKGDRALEGLARRCIALTGRADPQRPVGSLPDESWPRRRPPATPSRPACATTPGSPSPSRSRPPKAASRHSATRSASTPATHRRSSARRRTASAPPSRPSRPAPTRSPGCASPRSPSSGPPNAPPPPSATAATRVRSCRPSPGSSNSSNHHSPERSNCHAQSH
jgi:hypothetical protein